MEPEQRNFVVALPVESDLQNFGGEANSVDMPAAWLEEQNEDLRHVVGRLEANITSANKVIDDLRARNSQLEQTLTGVYTSRTWKLGRALTTPLRVFRRLTKGE